MKAHEKLKAVDQAIQYRQQIFSLIKEQIRLRDSLYKIAESCYFNVEDSREIARAALCPWGKKDCSIDKPCNGCINYTNSKEVNP